MHWAVKYLGFETDWTLSFRLRVKADVQYIAGCLNSTVLQERNARLDCYKIACSPGFIKSRHMYKRFKNERFGPDTLQVNYEQRLKNYLYVL